MLYHLDIIREDKNDDPRVCIVGRVEPLRSDSSLNVFNPKRVQWKNSTKLLKTTKTISTCVAACESTVLEVHLNSLTTGFGAQTLELEHRTK